MRSHDGTRVPAITATISASAPAKTRAETIAIIDLLPEGGTLCA